MGFIDEKFVEPSRDWVKEYEHIQHMTTTEILVNSASIIGNFPNNYCYTKRMAEEMLLAHRKHQI